MQLCPGLDMLRPKVSEVCKDIWPFLCYRHNNEDLKVVPVLKNKLTIEITECHSRGGLLTFCIDPNEGFPLTSHERYGGLIDRLSDCLFNS